MIEPQTVPSFRPPLYASPQRLIDGKLPPTKGAEVAAWQQRWLVHGEGDFRARPRRLTPFQLYVLMRALEYDPETGRLLYDRVVIGMPKGDSKSEDAAAYGIGEVYGPCRPLESPHVVVQAASYDQAKNVYHCAKDMIEAGPLASRFATFDHELYPHIGGGKMKRRAAVAGTSEGALPTCAIGDELHHWKTKTQKDMYAVQRLNLLKRQVPRHGGISGAQQFSISNAGEDKESLLGEQYQHGIRVATGEVEDPGLLFLWWEAPKPANEDLTDPVQLRAAIMAADPAIGYFKTLAQVEAGFSDPTIPRHDLERRSLNRWVTSPKSWIAEDSWKAKAKPKGLPPEGTPIVLGFDGSYNRDTTALMGWTLPLPEKPETADLIPAWEAECKLRGGVEWADYGFLVAAWEKDNQDPDWTVPRAEVDAAVYGAIQRYKVVELAGDPPGWITELEAWETEFGTRAVVGEEGDRLRGSGLVLRFETNQPARMGPACDHFRQAVLDPKSTLQHDGTPQVARHIKNCHTSERRNGAVIVKDAKDSPRKIDLAVACVIARERAHHQPKPRQRGVNAGF